MTVQLFCGDCLEIMPSLADKSIDAVICDPPYELGFMGKSWDSTGIANSVEVWKQALRVLKPGGYLLAFSGTRTYHRMASAIEDAGFEIRDMIEWVYGSGFPKSLNIGKAVDKTGGQSLSWFIDYILKVADEKGISRKELTMLFPSKNGNPTGWLWNKQKTQGITLEQYHKIKAFLQLPFADITECEREIVGRGKAGLTAGTIANFAGEKEFDLTKGTSEWEGWGTALKPAHEPICMARKPLAEKTVAENCLKYGTGGINIDESRVDYNGETPNIGGRANHTRGDGYGFKELGDKIEANTQGRFPANLIHDNSEEVRECFPEAKGWSSQKHNNFNPYGGNALNESETTRDGFHEGYNDSGNASRFFKSIIYAAKASKSDRGEGNSHPTVKPVALMEYLINMITKLEWIVLDPFMGSGTTGVACVNLGRNFIGIEKDPQYFEIAKERIAEAERRKNNEFFVKKPDAPTLFDFMLEDKQ